MGKHIIWLGISIKIAGRCQRPAAQSLIESYRVSPALARRRGVDIEHYERNGRVCGDGQLKACHRVLESCAPASITQVTRRIGDISSDKRRLEG